MAKYIENVTADTIRSWPVDAYGWHVSPDGVHVIIGERSSIAKMKGWAEE